MKVWRWPLVTAALSIAGLASALFYDGWGDAVSWVGLGLPIAQSVWFWTLRDRARVRQ